MEPTSRTVAEHLERVLAMVSPLPPRETTPAEIVDGGAVGPSSSGRPDVRVVGPSGDRLLDIGPTAPQGTDPAVLAEDVSAAHAVPAFDHSAMDGYAVRSGDLPAGSEPVVLRVVADIPAAPNEPRELAPGTAARIMTGAPLPPGADAVVPVERTSTGRFDPASESGVGAAGSVTLGRQPRDHIRRQGTDTAAGAVLARAGQELTAPLVAALAATGVSRVRVRRRPRVAIIATGSELVPSGSPVRPGQITDSNSLMLAAAARAAGADVVRLGPVPDEPDALRAALDDATFGPGEAHAGAGGVAGEPGDVAGRREEVAARPGEVVGGPGGAVAGPGRPAAEADPRVDLIVTAGGVSAGAADVVRAVLSAGGDRMPGGGPGAVSGVDVAAVGMKPGRPQALARWRGVPWIAVPGTPVAAYVSFVMFVRPAIERLRGLSGPGRAPESRPAAAGWTSPRGREQVVPVRILADGVEPTGDGHHLSALTAADALAVVPADVEKVEPGDLVPVIPL
ncbi:molybdopterin molybdotransferase MoeA [Myceligenerans pegani]|uniref:Molybdopterin molybdenumtransferase n=1 Tax=Myceligenerans pegani TaxID=2776917 RepID=A0ABR9MZX5_9MICO|nr:molybdopterin molybdotransferase MoeA [Myceligenerans sp. TRM 65318]MBE1876960.1 molybdopterin molybdotransferase MoeA [Myceligenerans sp. TRM 65318]MBE3019231.1 molybdopterin molybdotransferase MoeA [Myceligenerans sp. TRM 65318]